MPRRTWTDDGLREAVADARTWTDVLRRLGLGARSGGSLAAARRRAVELGLDTAHLPGRNGAVPRRWTDAELERAVASATSLAGVFRELDLQVGGGAWHRMREHIERLDLDTSHFTRGPRPPRAESGTWTDDDLRAALPGARSVSEVMRRLGLSVNAHGQRRRLVVRIGELGLPTDGLRGRRWASGRRGGGRRPKPLDEVLVAGRATSSTSQLRQRLLDEGFFERRCSACELTEWRSGPIPLQLDHIDGDPRNNLVTNLRLLCPNCHALTDTYCGRNIGRR